MSVFRCLGRARRTAETYSALLRWGESYWPLLSPQTGGPPLVGCARLRILTAALNFADAAFLPGDKGLTKEWISERLAWGVWIGFDWLRTGTDGGLL
jgi:hypothetical protein